MAKRKKVFTTAEAAAVWLAYEGICTLCEKPITDLRSNTVDHVLPENLQNKPDEFETVRKLYGLSDDFNLNDFGNWVSAHPKCNSRKGQTILEGVQAMGMILSRARRKGEEARRIYDRMMREKEFATALLALDSQIKAGSTTIPQLDILRALLEKAEESAPPEAQLLVDHNRWKVQVIKPWDMATVTDGTVSGETPTRTASEDMRERWLCDNCKSYGPWHIDSKTHDFLCLNCGKLLDLPTGKIDL